MSKNYCILAGGCFWCIAMPFYDLNGVIEVISGYSGGEYINPTYNEVKKQMTDHFEVIKIVYDDELVSYVEILNTYFRNIDPFDGEGQFIDRGNSYTTCVFYRDEDMYNVAKKIINDIEMLNNKIVCTKVLPENVFYTAEEEHQNYGIKNPEEIKKEMELSGRNK